MITIHQRRSGYQCGEKSARLAAREFALPLIASRRAIA
jgi:hypothetical protein